MEVDVQNSSGNRAGIRDLVLTFQISGLEDQVFTITSSVGVQVLNNFFLQLSPSSTVAFQVAGEVFETLGASAEYTLNVNAVPLPPAGFIFLTGLLGLALARRKNA